MDQHELESEQQSAGETPKAPKAAEAATPPDAHQDGDDVLGIIEDVDRQLERIRAARKVQDEEISTLAERFKSLEQAESDLKHARSQIQQQQKALAAAQQETEVERSRILEQEAALASRESELQSMSEAMDQRRDDLSKRLDQAEANVGELMTKIETLSEQLETQNTQLAEAVSNRDAIHESLADRDARLAEQQRKLELATKKLSEFSTVLGEQASQIEETAGAAALSQQQARQIEQLKRELAEAQDASVDTSVLEQRDERIADLEKQLATAAKSTRAEAKAIKQYEKRVAELEAQLAEAAAGDGDADALLEREERIAKLQAELDTVQRDRKADVKAMQQRDKRIAELEEALQAASTASSAREAEDKQARATAMEALNRKRQQLTQRRDALEQAERKMIRRWARPRAVVTVGWLCVLLCLNIAASWMANEHFFPAQRTASITIEPRTQRNAAPMDSAQIEQWQQWHMQLLSDDSFLQIVARRNAERRLDGFSDPRRLGAYFSENLSMSPGTDGDIAITLVGSDIWQTTAVLDILASTLTAESARRGSVRGDQSPAVARAAPDRDGRTQYAVASPYRMTDERLISGVIILSATTMLSLTLIWLVYSRLIHAKRIFDNEDGVFAAA